MQYIKGLFIVFFALFLIIDIQSMALSKENAPVSYVSAVKTATPSVVNIYTARDVGNALPMPQYYRRKTRRYSLGSGVLIDKKGDLLTNYHVVRRAKHILVALDDGRRTKATIIGVDQETDLAVLHVDLSNLHPAILGNSDKVEVGDIVLAIGNPFGLGQTVTQGIVSAMGRSTIGINQLEDYIQTDAAINPGNSGGALVNTRGELIGINTGIYSHSGGYQGVGFAIPINVAFNVMQQIIQTGSVKRGWLGVKIRAIDPALAQSMELPHTSGIVIVALLPKSPSKKAGMKVGDVVSYLNNRRIRTARGFFNYIAQRKPGSTIVIVYTRQHQTHRLKITLGTRPPQPIIDDRGSFQDNSADTSI